MDQYLKKIMEVCVYMKIIMEVCVYMKKIMEVCVYMKKIDIISMLLGDRRGRYCMVVGLTTTYAISAHHH